MPVGISGCHNFKIPRDPCVCNYKLGVFLYGKRQGPATGCPGAGSEFKVDGWIVMTLSNRSGQPVGSHVLLSPVVGCLVLSWM
jgi:hypothetical protein